MTTKTGDVHVTWQRRTGARRAVDVAYGYLAAFFVLGVPVQVYLAGIGIFGINSGKVADATSLDPHGPGARSLWCSRSSCSSWP